MYRSSYIHVFICMLHEILIKFKMLNCIKSKKKNKKNKIIHIFIFHRNVISYFKLLKFKIYKYHRNIFKR